jgi:hypothetical protein
MKDADDPIPAPTPEDTILYSDVFVEVYRALTPDWQLLEERWITDQEASHNRDKAQRRANKWLREKISQGALRALVRDPGDPNSKPPRPPQTFQLNRRRFASMSDFETGITDDHVGPGDIFQSGPDTVIAGKRRPVFFDRQEFNKVLSEIAPPATGIDTPPVKNKGGRPAEYDWDAMKAFALQKVKEFGRPGKDNKRLPSKAQLIELILNEWRERHGQEPASSSVRSHLNRWLGD